MDSAGAGIKEGEMTCYNGYCPKVANCVCMGFECLDWEKCPNFDGERPKIDVPYAVGKESNQVDHPSHYQGEYECIDLMREIYGDEAVRWFCILNIYKYRFRAGKKEGSTLADDEKKASWYEEYVMKKLANNPNTEALNIKKQMEELRDLRRSYPAGDANR